MIATFDRVPNVPNSPNSFAQFVRGIASVTKQGDDTLIIKTKAPNPKLAFEMSRVLIVPAKVAKSATTADFNSGKAAIGTGAYKVVEWVNGDRLVLARNDAFWGPKEPWAKVTEKVIAKDPTRVAALLAGEVDAIDLPAIADLPRLRADPRFTLTKGAAGLVHYIALDSARDVSPNVTAKDGKPLTSNPLKDPRVRKALSLAINRQVIADKLMEGSALPASQLLPTHVSGHQPEAEARSVRPARRRRRCSRKRAGATASASCSPRPTTAIPTTRPWRRRSARCGRGSGSRWRSRPCPAASSSAARASRNSAPSPRNTARRKRAPASARC